MIYLFINNIKDYLIKKKTENMQLLLYVNLKFKILIFILF